MINKETIIEGNFTYMIVREIARGGMGIIYEARQFGVEEFVKRVAIKEILSVNTRDRYSVNLFISEAKLVADLVHQNIVQVYHLDKRADSYYIVMEYIDGVNLEEFLDAHRKINQPVPVEIGVFIASRICRGLNYAHNKKDFQGNPMGIVHRDISPKNIMMTYEGEAKITDFGIAKARTYMSGQAKKFFMGKVAYMSPEQARSDHTDRRSDIFSTGTVLYRMLTGIQPFADKKSDITIANVTSKEIVPPTKLRPDIPQEVEKIIMKAMEREPAMRYQSAYEMGFALEYYMYHDRFGPNNLTLKAYLEKIIPPGPPRVEFFDMEDDTLATPDFEIPG